ncbi:hypothetical protein NEIMUCOT_06102 [Neisseria mucosa ATCC 25996]|uniref:Uncharacterized protein n=1 Tax=Neisseria mucosa (strain ATCC 25996 / DSM 4631 / NCTC 10774 / M26) TaxID=546266 RepID=D2ZZM5_NEIM2|nr:hypothetical protein NEIMUCOT_06102 [Neisseria mucosa ATCC 25996]
MPRLAVLSVLSAASSPCPDLKLIHYNTLCWSNKLNPLYKKGRLKTAILSRGMVFRRPFVLIVQTGFILRHPYR